MKLSILINNILIIEYENNLRPIESISKYFWLFKKTDWTNQNFKINLLLIINNPRVEKEYKIRTETIEILGKELMNQYPNKFKFHFINYSGLTANSIISVLDKMTADN